jgi:hypothetical protein
MLWLGTVLGSDIRFRIANKKMSRSKCEIHFFWRMQRFHCYLSTAAHCLVAESTQMHLHPYPIALQKPSELETKQLLEGNETRRVGGTNTRSSVLDWVAVRLLVTCASSNPNLRRKNGYVLRDREFSQIMTNHLGLDFHLVELLARVDTNDTTNHLRNDNHISQMRLDEVGLLVGLGFLLGLAQLLDQTHGLALETAVEPTASTGVDDIAELVRGEVEESARERMEG